MKHTLFDHALVRPALACLLAAALIFPDSPGAAAQTTAHFTVTADPTPNAAPGGLEPFTVTVGQLNEGQSSVSFGAGAMEPSHLRTWFQVDDGDGRSLTARRDRMSIGDQYGSALFDGAEVEILRLENGRFRSLRTARIAPGGHQPSPWINLLGPRQVIDGTAQSTRIQIPGAWRTGAQVHIGLVAVDRRGKISGIGVSNPVTLPDRDSRERRVAGAPVRQVGIISPLTGPDSLLVSAPGGVRAMLRDGSIHLSWDAPGLVGGLSLAGYIPMVSFAGDGPLAPSRIVFDTDGPAPRAGDLAILRAEVTRFARDVAQSPASYHVGQKNPQRDGMLKMLWEDTATSTSRLAPHAAASPVPLSGTHFLQSDVTADTPLVLERWQLGPTVPPYRHPIKPNTDYTLSFWGRVAADGTATATFEVPPFIRAVERESGLNLLTRDVALTSDWTRHSITFQSTAVEVTRPVRVQLRVEGSGTVEIDNLELTEDGIPAGYATQAFANRLEQANAAHVRLHGTIKTGDKTYSMQQLVGLPSGVGIVGLHPFLTLLEQTGTQPWLQIEPHMRAQEWQGLVEYLAAPWDPARDSAQTKPYAALRVAQGRVAPWTDSFDTIRFELGNEMWNWLFSPWVALNLRDQARDQTVSRGAMLGAYQAHVAAIMSQSPYWPVLAPKWKTVIGGWALKPEFGADAARAAARAGHPVDYVGIAAYVGGWDEGEKVVKPTPEGFTSMLSHALQVARPAARQHRAALAALAADGLPVPDHITYEGGPGYVLNGLNNARVTPEQADRQEKVMKSVASGTATLDSFLARIDEGTTQLNFFNLRNGETWSSHAHAARGDHPYPAFEWAQHLGRTLSGRPLRVDAGSVPRTRFAPIARRPEIADAPLVAAYALRDDTTLSVIVISRMIPGAPGVPGDGAAEVTIDLPIRGADRVTHLRMTGRYDDHDVERDMARLETTTAAPPASLPRLALTLAPGSAQAFVFEDVRW